MNPITIEISPGELIDRITILQIRVRNVTDPHKQPRIRRELESLLSVRQHAIAARADLQNLFGNLATVNEALWRIEDDLRLCERRRDFGASFVDLARSVYRLNDRRSRLKQSINKMLGVENAEEKIYSHAAPDPP
ncbi:MAG: DUF6165 family protein [Planctomycetota bacterium]|nr:DUF6165 family protein [Planctomycetota bacterium]